MVVAIRRWKARRATHVALAMLALLGGALLAPRPGRAARAPRGVLAEVMGLAPGMSEERAHRVLARAGARLEVSGEAGEGEDTESGLEREVWRLRSGRYAWIQLAIDRGHRVRALQAHVRPGGPGLRYADIGDPAQARRQGYTILVWEVPARDGRAGLRVIARGADPVLAASVALAALD